MAVAATEGDQLRLGVFRELTRQARELVIWAVQGGPLEWWAPVGALVSSGLLLALVLVLIRRDQGRRFR